MTLTLKDFTIGEQVRFGRKRGQQSLGTVVSKGRTKLKVRLDEARGTRKAHKVGGIWTVPVSLCTPTGTVASCKPGVTITVTRIDADILKDAKHIMWCLEPEILHQDGERSPSAARKVAANLRRQFRALEAELGRKITEFGSIDGAMPVTLGFHSAKTSGFSKGQKVQFIGNGGKVVVGYVKRVNQKTVSVAPIGATNGRYWRVSPNLLSAAA